MMWTSRTGISRRGPAGRLQWQRCLSSSISGLGRRDDFYNKCEAAVAVLPGPGPDPDPVTQTPDLSYTAESGPHMKLVPLPPTLRGEIVDYAVDIATVRPGQTIDVPYELTIAPSFRDFWQSAFYSHDRINTSTPFARSLG